MEPPGRKQAADERAADGQARDAKAQGAERRGVVVAPELFDGGGAGPPLEPLERRFELAELLGQGGMGAVFLARDRRLGRTVAIKVLTPEGQRDAALRGRFLVEAQVGAQLEHPNIVPLYGVERSEDGRPAFAMQLVEGETMARYIAGCAEAFDRDERGERAGLKRRVERLLPVCAAIDYAHGRGVVHRDLKPDNVMLGVHNEVFVMDWGVARVVAEGAGGQGAGGQGAGAGGGEEAPVSVGRLVFDLRSGALQRSQPTATVPSSGVEPGKSPSGRAVTAAGEVVGTIHYMAPEQARGQVDAVGEAADQFALGVMLYELATLRPARSGDDVAALYDAALSGQVGPMLDRGGRALDPGLGAIVARATARRPEARYASVRAFAEDLGRFVRDEELWVMPDGPARSFARRVRERPAAALAAVLVALLSAALAVAVSLAKRAREAREAAHDIDALAGVTAAVGRRSHEVDVRFHEIAGRIAGVAAAASAHLRHAPPLPGPLHLFTEFDAGMPGARYVERSGKYYSYAVPSFAFAPGVRGPETEDAARRLLHLVPLMREAMLDSARVDLRALPAQAQEEALFAGQTPLTRVCVAYESGLYMHLPGSGGPPGYDPRSRPWYLAARGQRGPIWGAPFREAAGGTMRLPGLLPLWEGDRFVGVACGDLLLDDTLSMLSMPEQPGFVDGYLVDEQGRVVVQRAMLAPDAPMDNSQPPLPLARRPALLAAVREGKTVGHLVDGDRLVVFARMVAPPWYFVAELERSLYLSSR